MHYTQGLDTALKTHCLSNRYTAMEDATSYNRCKGIRICHRRHKDTLFPHGVS